MGEQGVPAGLDSGAKQPPKRRLEGEELCNPQDMGAVGAGQAATGVLLQSWG